MSASRGARAATTAALSARARTVIAAGLAGLLLGFLWGVADVPRYTASATVLVSGGGGAPAADAELGAAAELAAGAEVADRAAGLLGGDVSGADLLSEIEASADPSAGAVRIEAEADSPDFAAAAANGYAMALVDVGGKHYGEGAAADIPGAPSANRSALGWSLIGLLAGLLAGLAAVAIAGRRRAAYSEPSAPWTEPASRLPVRGAEDGFNGAPILARIADPAGLIGGGDEAIEIDRAGARIFADVAAELRLDEPDQAPRRLAVLEPATGEGALAVVFGLAVAAADLGLRAIVVEADLDEPALASRIGVRARPGLRDYLRGTAGPRDVLRSVPVGVGGERAALVCVPAGESGGPPPEGVGGERFAALIRRLPRAYDLILLCGPPVGRGAEAAAIARLMDGVVLVAADEGEAGPRIADAVAALGDASLLGAVLVAQSRGQSSAERPARGNR